MERLYQRLRNYENSMTVAMKDSLRFYLRNRECGVDGKNLVMGLIADQNPPRRPDSHWFRFLNQDTIFFRRRGEAGAALQTAGLFRQDGPSAAGPLPDVVRADLRR